MKIKNFTIALMLFLGMAFQLKAQHNYAEALQKSMFFYEVQRAGDLPDENRVNWRGDAFLGDGSDVGADLSKGWLDAGDNVKFNFPMAWSVTVLSWGALEYGDGYVSSGQMPYLLDNIKWVTDYFINCHPEPNKYYYQVGDGDADHAKWTAAEVVEHIMERPTAVVDPGTPGSDVAAETAAAMAAASILFKNSDPAYSATLLQHAIDLYNFADTYRGSYPLGSFYKSWSGYTDELVWGAIWLYKATGDASYLAKAEATYDDMGKEIGSNTPVYKHTFSWDDKTYASYVLLAQITGDQKYKTDAERYLDFWAYDIERTPEGLPYQADNRWGILRYASNTALCALVYSDIVEDVTKKQDYYNMAKFIADYALGNNPEDMSYVVGYGNDWPKHIHHRTAHGWPDGFPHSDVPDNRHIMYGALVGGPDFSDVYIDDINQYEFTEVACDYNAGFSGVIARMAMDNGGEPLANFPIPEVPDKEFYVNLKLNTSSENSFELLGWLVNATAWPARYSDNAAFRYYINITEGIAAGYSASDYVTGGNGTVSGLIPWDMDQNIYYVESVMENTPIYPAGEGEKQEFVSLSISLPGAPASAWDVSNDWSYQGIESTSDYVYNPYMSVYEDGEYIDGLEPNGELVPVEGVTLSPSVLELCVGDNLPLTATVTPINASNKSVNYASSNTTVATVSNTGVVTGIGLGNATITVTTVDGGFTAQTSIAVSACNIPVTGITVSPVSLDLDLGETAVVTPNVIPSNATNKEVTWSSDAHAIASVSTTGLVTGLEEGNAVITATTVDGEFTAVCSVLVSDIVKPTYTLTVTSGANGSVEVLPIKVEYNEGEIVSLEAIADDGYRFEAWSGDLSGTDAATTIEMDSDKNVSASFVVRSGGCDNPETVTLPHKIDGVIETCVQTSGTIEYINSWGADEITINGVDITNLYVSQMPPKEDGKYKISFKGSVGWSHIEIIGTSGPITEFDLTSEVIGNGSITPASGTFTENTEVSLTATPDDGWKFDGWSGDASSTIATTSIIMSSDKNVIATFSEIQNPIYYTLLVTASEGGTVDPTGGEFLEGSTVILTATPDEGYRVKGWNGIPDPVATFSVLMNANKSVTVQFEKIEGECFDESPMASALPSIHSSYNYIYVLGSGPDLTQIRDFTINWDLVNNGLWQFSMNTSNGSPSWYVDLLSKTNHTLNAAQPTLSIDGSGIPGLDDEYYAVIDGENFALVSKSGEYSIYFSTSASSPCTKSAPADSDSFTANVKLYPNPASEFIHIENIQNVTDIQIMNTLGQLVYSQIVNNVDAETISINGLQTGGYILMLNQEDGSRITEMFYVK